jgi:hypothetical protein
MMSLTLDSIAIKLALANRKGYLAYALSACLSVWVIFVIATLYSIPDVLRSAAISRPSLYAPALAAFLFTAFVSTYACNSLMRIRGRESGTYALLGMSRAQIVAIALVQQGLVLLVSLVVGLLMGSGTMLLVSQLVRVWLGNTAPAIRITPVAYGYTALTFAVAITPGVAVSAIRTCTSRIVELMKSSRTTRKSWFEAPAAGLGGVAAIITGGGLSLVGVDIGVGARVCLFAVGLFLVSMNMSGTIPMAIEMLSRTRHRHTVAVASLRSVLRTSRYLVFAVCVVSAIAMFFMSFGVLILADAERAAAAHCPFDLAFAQMSRDEEFSSSRVETLAGTGRSEIASARRIRFTITDHRVVVPLTDVYDMFGTRHDVGSGEFVWVSQTPQEDNYRVALKGAPAGVSLLGSEYQRVGELDGMLINNVPRVSRGKPGLVVVSETDFESLSTFMSGREDRGVIWLLDLADWRRSDDAHRAISEALLDAFGGDATHASPSDVEELREYVSPSSRLVYLTRLRRRSGFTLILFGLVSLLFLIALPSTVHFRFLMDFEAHVVVFRKLRWIGMTRIELAKIVRIEVGALFMIPATIGTIGAILPAWTLPAIVGDTNMAASGTVAVGLAFICIQAVCSIAYWSILSRRLLASSERAGRRTT